MTLTATHIIGILLTVGLLLAVSILSGRKVKDAHSFATGGKAGSWMVCGAILGTLVGGQSTIGTRPGRSYLPNDSVIIMYAIVVISFAPGCR
jgi:Na+/proline symporter